MMSNEFVLPDSPNSCDNERQLTTIASSSSAYQLNSILDMEVPSEKDFLAVDPPCSLQEKSDQDILKDNVEPPGPVLPLLNVVVPERHPERDACLKLSKVKTSLINHYARSVPIKHFNAHFGHKLASRGYDSVKSGATMFIQKAFRVISENWLNVNPETYKNRQELMERNARRLSKMQKIFYEENQYVLLNKEDAKNLKEAKAVVNLTRCPLATRQAMKMQAIANMKYCRVIILKQQLKNNQKMPVAQKEAENDQKTFKRKAIVDSNSTNPNCIKGSKIGPKKTKSSGDALSPCNVAVGHKNSSKNGQDSDVSMSDMSDEESVGSPKTEATTPSQVPQDCSQSTSEVTPQDDYVGANQTIETSSSS